MRSIVLALLMFGLACGGSSTTPPSAPLRPPMREAKFAKSGRLPPGDRGKAPLGGGGLGLPRLALNNTPVIERTRDGVVHAIFVDERGVVYRQQAPGDRPSDKVIHGDSSAQGATVATDRDKALILVWNVGGALTSTTSEDGGSTWSPPVALPTGGDKPAAPSVRVWTDSAGTHAVVVWFEGEKKVSTRVYGSVLHNGEWRDAVRIDSGTASAEFPAVGGHGDRTVAVWRDNRNGEWRVYLARLDSPTGKWKEEQDLGFMGRDPSVCVTSDGTTHLAYQKPPKRLTVTHSTGHDWAEPQELGIGLFGRVDCNDAGQVVVAWESFTADGTVQDDAIKTVGLAVSTDNGEHFKVIEPSNGRLNLVLSSATLDAQGTLDAIWIDRSSGEVELWNHKL